MELYEKDYNKLSKDMNILIYLFENLIINISKIADELGLAYNTQATFIKYLVELGILEQINNNKRNRMFIYRRYIDILKDGTEL